MKVITEVVPASAEVSTRRARVYAFVMRHPVLRRLVAVFSAFVALFGAPVAAFATPPDSADTLFSGAQDSMTGTLIPAVVGIVLVGALFWLALKWFQKGKNAGNK